LKDVDWIGDSLKKLKRFPEGARKDIGDVLHFAQRGEKHRFSKQMNYIGSGIFEICVDDNTDTFRCVHAVNFKDKIYVLHSFKKKSTKGISTPKKEVDIIKKRYKELINEVR
jgi:phage-related protein